MGGWSITILVLLGLNLLEARTVSEFPFQASGSVS